MLFLRAERSAACRRRGVMASVPVRIVLGVLGESVTAAFCLREGVFGCWSPDSSCFLARAFLPLGVTVPGVGASSASSSFFAGLFPLWLVGPFAAAAA